MSALNPWSNPNLETRNLLGHNNVFKDTQIGFSGAEATRSELPPRGRPSFRPLGFKKSKL